MMAWNFDISQAPRGTVRMVERTIGKNTVSVEDHTPDLIIAAGDGAAVLRTCDG